jgi:hypothetical protein
MKGPDNYSSNGNDGGTERDGGSERDGGRHREERKGGEGRGWCVEWVLYRYRGSILILIVVVMMMEGSTQPTRL